MTGLTFVEAEKQAGHTIVKYEQTIDEAITGGGIALNGSLTAQGVAAGGSSTIVAPVALAAGPTYGAYLLSDHVIAPALFPINSSTMSSDKFSLQMIDDEADRLKTARLYYDLHHLFPQQLRQRFLAKGIVIDEFCIRLERRFHRSGVHGKGGIRLVPGGTVAPGRFNGRFLAYMDAHPRATPDEIFGYVEHLIREFGRDGIEIVPYK